MFEAFAQGGNKGRAGFNGGGWEWFGGGDAGMEMGGGVN